MTHRVRSISTPLANAPPLPSKEFTRTHVFVQLSLPGCLPILLGWVSKFYPAGPKLILFATIY